MKQLLRCLNAGFLFGLCSTAFAGDFTFTSIDFPGAVRTVAFGINDSGIIVGLYTLGSSDHAFSFDGTTFTTIDFPGAQSAAVAINNAGVVVGDYFIGTVSHAFSFDGTTYTTNDVPGADQTFAYGLNDAGVIVGYSRTGSVVHGYRFDGTTFTTIDCETDGSIVTGINTAGKMVMTTLAGHAFLRDGTSCINIDVPGADRTLVFGINDSDQMVGAFTGGPLGVDGLIRMGTAMGKVNFPGAQDTTARKLNNLGQIVGHYSPVAATFESHGFLLTPSP
jgi:hypothetical protein